MSTHVTPRLEIGQEEWRDVEGQPGYQVSNLGRVRSRRPIGGRGTLAAVWRLMKPQKPKSGYVLIRMSLAGRMPLYRTYHVHNLVLTAFVGPRPEGQECRHLDGNNANNVLSNLSWGTHSENNLDKRRHGTALEGEKHSLAKLTRAQVLEMRLLHVSGVPAAHLGSRFGISRGQAWRICKGENWACLDR